MAKKDKQEEGGEVQEAGQEIVSSVKIKNGAEAGTNVTSSHILPGNLTDLIAQCGEQVVYTNAVTGMKTQLRNTMYRCASAEKGSSAAEVQAAGDNWKPSVHIAGAGRAPKDPVARFEKDLSSVSAEEQLAILERVREKLLERQNANAAS